MMVTFPDLSWCRYCTFAQPPTPNKRAYMTIEEVLQIAALGAKQGCAEALFTLGEREAALERGLCFPLSSAEYLEHMLCCMRTVQLHA